MASNQEPVTQDIRLYLTGAQPERDAAIEAELEALDRIRAFIESAETDIRAQQLIQYYEQVVAEFRRLANPTQLDDADRAQARDAAYAAALAGLAGEINAARGASTDSRRPGVAERVRLGRRTIQAATDAAETRARRDIQVQRGAELPGELAAQAEAAAAQARADLLAKAEATGEEYANYLRFHAVFEAGDEAEAAVRATAEAAARAAPLSQEDRERIGAARATAFADAVDQQFSALQALIGRLAWRGLAERHARAIRFRHALGAG